jgi:hypothetical protein
VFTVRCINLDLPLMVRASGDERSRRAACCMIGP